MEKLEKLVVIFLVIGILLCFLGWTHTFPFSAKSYEYEQVLTRSTIKLYVLLSTGGLLIAISLILSRFIKVINQEIEVLSNKYSKLERRINKIDLNEQTHLH